MYNTIKHNTLDYKSDVYICKRLGVQQDENLNQVEVFEKPIKYKFNIQPVSEDSEIKEFGELANSMRRVVITEKQKYLKKFKEFDKVYVDTIPDDTEKKYGVNADYRIYSIRPQNVCLVMYFIKIVKGGNYE